MAAIACVEYFEAGIVEALNKRDEVKDVDDDAVADLETFVGGGGGGPNILLAACGRWSLSNRRYNSGSRSLSVVIHVVS